MLALPPPPPLIDYLIGLIDSLSHYRLGASSLAKGSTDELSP